eukprot:441189-Hanusia_phi.AAC.1
MHRTVMIRSDSPGARPVPAAVTVTVSGPHDARRPPRRRLVTEPQCLAVRSDPIRAESDQYCASLGPARAGP